MKYFLFIATNLVKGGRVLKIALFFCLVMGLCFGQSITSDSILEINAESFGKSLSIEIFGGNYFTFEHEMEYSGITLPFSMWRGGGRIIYHTAPNLVLSLTGSYSYTRNLSYITLDIFESPELKFAVDDVSFGLSYTRSGYFIGTGIDFSYVKVTSKGLFGLMYRDTSLTVVSLRPSIAGGLNLKLFSPLYLAMRLECDFHRFMNIGSEGVHLGDILPSANIGLGYNFSAKRGVP